MKKIFIAAAVALCFSACTKENVVNLPSFDVTTEKATYKLGDTVRFKFSGDADYLSMYTGETGSNYIYKDRTRAEGKVTVTANTNLRNDNGVKTLSLFVITDLNPLRDSASVVDAPWIDISDRVTIPVLTTGTSVSIGTADITDLTKPNKPIYLAWKFASNNSTTAVQPRWTITVMNLFNELPDGSKTTIAGIAQMGWKGVSVKNSAYAWILGPTIYTNAPAKNSGDTENWAVSGPLYPDAITRDYPKAIKDIIAVMPADYEYIYKAKGTYKVYFVALNSRNGISETITKEVEITIE
ncbi:DUF5017 domain-containing protein [Pedobacter arcticus]|uniref:DUF5017 domain-containing protein n=1 Tax=Pedobacter arcticus TaxID=752140 RepID=UPI0003054AF2|nr:DUF5017 domain-containing protein [Pedobacter arcticus]